MMVFTPPHVFPNISIAVEQHYIVADLAISTGYRGVIAGPETPEAITTTTPFTLRRRELLLARATPTAE